MPQVAVKRLEVKPGEVLCTYCTGRCCRYFSLPIETPRTWNDFDNMRWYMMHGKVSIFVDQGTWYLVIHADCRHLLADNRCGVYDDRPSICRKYSTANCEYDNDFLYDRIFESPDQIWEYAEAVLPPRRAKKNGKSIAINLPILSN